MTQSHVNGRIGFMGGTYDPPHNGHLHLALSLAELHSLDEVWFCPAWTNPHKQERNICAPQHRLAMIQRAVEPIAQFHVLDIECKRQEVSYTVETLRALHASEQASPQPRQLFLLIGEDCARQLHTWKNAEEIIQLAPPLVGARSSSQFQPPEYLSRGLQKLNAKLQTGWTPIPLLEISSTHLRYRLQNGMYCRHLIPPKVVDYICSHELY